MYKHIFKEQRHSSVNFEHNNLLLDSYIDISDISNKFNAYRDSVMSKSRMGTAEL